MTTETKEEKFIRLAEARVPKALDAIRLVGQLSSANYSYSTDAALEVVGALQDAVDDVRSKYGISSSAHVVEPATPQETTVPGPTFPQPVVLSADELEYDGPVNAEDIRNVIKLLTYHQDIQGALTVLRNALIEEPRNA